ncbi:hypothetical protein DT384_16335, partial [Pseudomonas aeruginosa]
MSIFRHPLCACPSPAGAGPIEPSLCRSATRSSCNPSTRPPPGGLFISGGLHARDHRYQAVQLPRGARRDPLPGVEGRHQRYRCLLYTS